TGPAHGTLTGSAPSLVYTPAAGYAGADSFTFKANDGFFDGNTATISISVVAVPPAILGFSPSGGAPGTAVTITGTALTGATQVKFNTTVQPSFTTGPATPLKTNFGTNAGPIAAAVADLDGDGKNDVVVANHGFSGNIGNTISVLRNVGT